MLTKGMRSIWAVVVTCLVAVASVRPTERTALDRDHVATLAQAHAALPVLARRDRDRHPDVQLPTAMLPELATWAPPVVTIEVVFHAARVAAASPVPTPRSSRGPPRA